MGIARRWAPRAHRVMRTFMGLPSVAVLADLVWRFELDGLTDRVASAQLGFRGRLPMDDGMGMGPPVDVQAARLALLRRDTATLATPRTNITGRRGILVGGVSGRPAPPLR